MKYDVYKHNLNQKQNLSSSKQRLYQMSDEPQGDPGQQQQQEGRQGMAQKSAQQLLEQQKQREQQARLREEQQRKLEQQARIKRQQDMKKLEQALKGSVGGLGKTADNTSMTNIRLTLAEKELERLFPSILRYQEIQHLDLNTNALSDGSVVVLLDFPHLLTLNLSKNQITHLKQFNPEQPKLAKLQFLNLSTNKIKHLSQVGLPALRKLNLNENQISSVQDWKGHSSLAVLELRKNKLRKLKGLTNMKNLTELYVCQNQITDLRGLQNCNALQKLSLRNNKIKTILSPFPYLPGLVYLNLRENQINSIKQLCKIDEHINNISILANPASQQLGQNLKKQVTWLLPHIVRINKSVVTEEERVQFEKERLEKLALEEKERLEKEEEARRLVAEQEQQQADKGADPVPQD